MSLPYELNQRDTFDRPALIIAASVVIAHAIFFVWMAYFGDHASLPKAVKEAKRFVVQTVELQPAAPQPRVTAPVVEVQQPVPEAPKIEPQPKMEKAKEAPPPVPTTPKAISAPKPPKPVATPKKAPVAKPAPAKPVTKAQAPAKQPTKPKAVSKPVAKSAPAPVKTPSVQKTDNTAREAEAAQKQKELQQQQEREAAQKQERQRQQKLIADAQESIAKIGAVRDKVTAGKASSPSLTAVSSVPISLHIDAMPAVAGAPELSFKEVAYRDELAGRLKLLLRLPEYGDVKVKLTLERSGKVVKVVVDSAESATNKKYIEKTLPDVSFPPFGSNFGSDAQYTFSITLSNE